MFTKQLMNTMENADLKTSEQKLVTELLKKSVVTDNICCRNSSIKTKWLYYSLLIPIGLLVTILVYFFLR